MEYKRLIGIAASFEDHEIYCLPQALLVCKTMFVPRFLYNHFHYLYLYHSLWICRIRLLYVMNLLFLAYASLLTEAFWLIMIVSGNGSHRCCWFVFVLLIITTIATKHICFLPVVLFCLAAVVFPMGFYVEEIGGEPYQLPNSFQVCEWQNVVDTWGV